MPTPAPKGASRSGGEDAAGGDEAALEYRIFRLAAFGVPVEEIETLCEEEIHHLGWDEARVDEVVERGRCWGRAKVMEAQFTAALTGKVSAQAQMLARLEAEEEREPGEEEAEITFVRKVEGEEQGDDPEHPTGEDWE